MDRKSDLNQKPCAVFRFSFRHLFLKKRDMRFEIKWLQKNLYAYH